MKLTFISVLASWLFATGVAVTSNYCFSVGGADSASQKKAEKIASRISKRGSIPEYKAKNRHCSAIKKTTTAKVTQKEIKQPTYLDNPLYPSFTNALNNLSAEVAETAKPKFQGIATPRVAIPGLFYWGFRVFGCGNTAPLTGNAADSNKAIRLRAIRISASGVRSVRRPSRRRCRRWRSSYVPSFQAPR